MVSPRHVPEPNVKLIFGAIILILVVSLSSLTVGLGLWLRQNHQACLSRQHGWDNRKTAWVKLTEPTPFAPTTDPERTEAEQAINDRHMQIRNELLAGLGPRPHC